MNEQAPGILKSGLDQIDRDLAALPKGKSVAVIATVDERGVRVAGTAALDAQGQWQLSTELEKRRREKGLRWHATVAWSR
ncbi:MAG TPA: hypothetical protein VNJ02_10490 [Vicinamibacterales bacterium]|nr:hypothetical protein [Vicinamibacterales bacterium]